MIKLNRIIRQSKSGDSFIFFRMGPKKLFCLSLDETYKEESCGAVGGMLNNYFDLLVLLSIREI